MEDEAAKYQGWFAHHQATCGAKEFQVTWQFGKDAIFLVILCPKCEDSIRGFVDNDDWARVVALVDSIRES